MRVLGVDTTTRQGRLALVDGADRHVERDGTDRTHGERLPGDVLALLERAGWSMSDLDLFAVVSGPGSFTGLRVGMATVQGLAVTTGRKVVPVPTFDAVLLAWRDQAPLETRLVAVCLDAQRGDVFYAVYDPGASAGSAPAVVLPPAVDTPERAARSVRARVGAASVVLTGTGAARHAEAFQVALEQVTVAEIAMPLALAAALGAAAEPWRAVDPGALRPVYVRRPDAVLARERARTGAAPDPGVERADPRVSLASTDADLADIERLQRESFPRSWGEEALRWELEHRDVARLYLMRDGDGEAVAFCACWTLVDELHINSLAVAVTHRRRGLARRLLATVIGDAVRLGARSATLEVRESNVAARALYEGLGFRVEGVRRDYYQDPREDAVILWRRSLGDS